MPLIVTPGAADADSYVSLGDAAAFHTARGNATWTGTDALKEAALRRATAWLDGRYRNRWPGIRLYARAQALDWPRTGAQDREGNYITATTIPAEVVNATCEAALRELVTPGSLSPDVTPGTIKVLTAVDSLQWTPLRSIADASDMAPTLLAVDRALSGIIGSGASVSLLRA